jgi:hypothetical protein
MAALANNAVQIGRTERASIDRQTSRCTRHRPRRSRAAAGRECPQALNFRFQESRADPRVSAPGQSAPFTTACFDPERTCQDWLTYLASAGCLTGL